MKKIVMLALLMYAGFIKAQINTNVFDSLAKVYEANGFHGVILVANADKVLYEKGYGLANFEKKIKQDPSKEFKTESVGKMFTAVSVLQLVEQGKLKLDDKVKNLLPWLNIKNADKITVHHLLGHTSGLQSPWDHPKWQFKKTYSNEEMAKVVEEVPLAFDEPGEKMYYSNSGYVILGWIIEKVSGLPFDVYFQKNIFSVAGMKNTRHLNDTLMPVTTGAQPYKIISSKRHIQMNDHLGEKASAAGGWISTASDLYKFMLGLYQGKYIKPDTWKMMQTANGTAPKDSSYRFYAYGLETYVNLWLPGANVYGHNGGGAGFSIDAFIEPATGTIVVSCSNMYQNSRPIALNYLKAALGKPLSKVEQPAAIRIFDVMEQVGVDNFIANEKDYFEKLAINPIAFTFAQVNDGMGALKMHDEQIKWLQLGRQKFPDEPFIYMISGDTYAEMKNKDEAKKMYTQAKEIALKKNDQFLIGVADQKIKEL